MRNYLALIGALFWITVLQLFSSTPLAADPAGLQDAQQEFVLFHSANVYGELEPCG